MASAEELHAPQEDDQLATRALAVIGMVSLGVILIDLWIAFAILPPQPYGMEHAPMPAERFGFDPSPIESFDRAAIFYERGRDRLEEARLIAPEAGVARIPIEDAMRLHLERRQTP